METSSLAGFLSTVGCGSCAWFIFKLYLFLFFVLFIGGAGVGFVHATVYTWKLGQHMGTRFFLSPYGFLGSNSGKSGLVSRTLTHTHPKPSCLPSVWYF